MDGSAITATCCIVGGGPAGIMLGLILARAGVEVVVLEKHADFFRDFRGDTIHPSTLDIVDQLGLRQRFDAIPRTALSSLDVVVAGTRLKPVNFGHLRGRNKQLVLMPQWDLLDLLADEAKTLPNFRLLMNTEATGVVSSHGVVTGVIAETEDGTIQVDAALTVAADGRESRIRSAAGLRVRDFGVPLDVLWFRLPKPRLNPPDTLAYIGAETLVITIPRIGYYQAAMLIRKGSFPEVREAGLPKLREAVVRTATFLGPVIDSLEDWDQVKLLTVQVNRLRRWHTPGLLCIGDAAHAMSPAFGVGVNLAVQDAVATANLLAAPLIAGTVTDRDLAALQRRRALPVRVTQRVQLRLHRFIARPGAGANIPYPLPRSIRILLGATMPVIRRAAGRLVGRGIRPERIRRELL
jgi:2-polyprenyl-6-methoxyphenol hydroxylase-like FAD-dependent oxidoreductase